MINHSFLPKSRCFNPYTGAIRPEPGPNMMWNEEYSMMQGMHGSFSEWSRKEVIPEKEAIDFANEYLQQKDPSLKVKDEGHQFSGYYTFHVEKNAEDYGMLSVHGTTGEVWYHSWHGELKDIITFH